MVAPSNHFALHSVKTGAGGVVAFNLKLPDPGSITATETAVVAVTTHGHRHNASVVYARVQASPPTRPRRSGCACARAARAAGCCESTHTWWSGWQVTFTPKYGTARTLKSIRIHLRS